MSRPTEFDPHLSSIGLPVREVPIIRVFGSTLCGQQACLHIHGYLPYFYLPLPNKVDPTAFALQVHMSLEAVARKYIHDWKKRKKLKRRSDVNHDYKGSRERSPQTPGHSMPTPSDNGNNTSSGKLESSLPSSKTLSVRSTMLSQSARHLNLLRRKKAENAAHIHRVDIVEHVVFYGYYTKPRKFLKIYHYNPALTKHLAGYAFNKGFGKYKLQPHEVHISYLMHFLSDYNIKGMDYIYLSSAIKMRGPLPLHPRCFIQPHPLWQRVVEATKKNFVYGQYMFMKPIVRNSPSVFLSEHPKRSTCELEIDAHIATILNIVELNGGLIQGSQDNSQSTFAVGGYMGESNCFFQQWDQQCARLNTASVSSFDSCDNYMTTFASNDTLRPFYRHLLRQAQQLDDERAEAARFTLNQLIMKLEGNVGTIREECIGSQGRCETITMNSTIIHTMEKHAYEEMDTNIYVYRYMVPPPKLYSGAKVTGNEGIRTGNINIEEMHGNITDDVKATSSADNASDGKPDGGIVDGLQLIDLPNVESLSEKFAEVDNFENGIVIDVVTDIEFNRIHPDPQRNAITAVVYTLRDYRLKPRFEKIGIPYADVQGAIVVDPNGKYVEFPDRVNVAEYKKWALVQRRNVNMDDIERAIYSGKLTDISFVSSEIQLLESLRSLILRFDPNIIYGYDIARSSIGYVNQRAAVLGMLGFIESVSRIVPRSKDHPNNSTDGTTDTSTLLTHQQSKLKRQHLKESAIQPLFCAGRLLFDLMDVALRELNMAELSLENIVYNQFGYTMPSYNMHTLNKWLTTKVRLPEDGSVDYRRGVDMGISSECLPNLKDAGNHSGSLHGTLPFNGNFYPKEGDGRNIISPHAFRCIRHVLLRNYAVIAVFDKLMYFPKYITFSKLYGIDLKSTIVRGSQYHVESILVRFTKSSNYILPSPTERQVHEQRPSAAIPIVMQPISGFHVDPVAVLDFQSLYSCITIAYNICYSTCLGLLSEHVTRNNKVKLGVMTYYPEKGAFRDIISRSIDASLFSEHVVGIHIMPNGVMFVDKNIREGILPTMLKSVLYSRRRIKMAMSRNMGDEMTMQRWHHEQHGLKMISNLSVGLTASGFSGRMPCSDLAESVVSIARALILFCTELVHDNFDAQVIYGDTDSIFVKFPGRTVAEAQELANRIADKINSSIPEPIKILPQKVYSPCLLVSKKRYVGLCHVKGKTTFDDKGIETMRTSECHATRNIIKEALQSIFKTVSLDKTYEEILRIFRNVGSVYTPKDFILYRQIRLGTYREEITGKVGTLPAAAIVAKYKMHKHYGNRVLENEYIPHVFSLSAVDDHRGIKESAVFPNEISGIFKTTDYVKEVRYRTLPQNSIANILEQLRRGQPLQKVDVDYYLKRQVLPPLKRMLQLLDVHPEFSVTEEIFKKLGGTSSTLGERSDRIVKSNCRTEDIWVYTGRLTQCIGCRTPCKIKLGRVPTEDDDATTDYEASQGFADAIQHGSSVRVTPLQENVFSFDSASSKKHHVIICDDCKQHPKHTLLNVVNELNTLEKTVNAIHNICLNCTGNAIGSASCQNAWHCEVYFKRIAYKKAFSRALKEYRSLLTLAYTN